MFTYTLVYRQWLAALGMPFEKARVWFLDFNRHGVVTYSLIVCGGIMVAVYLVSLYFAMSFGMEIKSGNELLSELSEEVRKEEFTLQDLTTGFANKNQDVLQSMEKVSAIKYLAPETVVLSRPAINP